MKLIIITFGLFFLGFFSSWAMDSYQFRRRQMPKWLQWLDLHMKRRDQKVIFLFVKWPPMMLNDPWHLFKTFLVGAIIGLASILISQTIEIHFHRFVWSHFWTNAGIVFVGLSVIWNFAWYVFYDRRYKG